MMVVMMMVLEFGPNARSDWAENAVHVKRAAPHTQITV